MPTVKSCSKCQSYKIIPRVRIKGAPGSGHHLSAEFSQNPAAFIFTGTRRSEISAWVCGDCGYTELYVWNPQELYLAYMAALAVEDK